MRGMREKGGYHVSGNIIVFHLRGTRHLGAFAFNVQESGREAFLTRIRPFRWAGLASQLMMGLILASIDWIGI